MSIYDRFFKDKGDGGSNTDLSGLISIPTKCPACGEVGEFLLDISGHKKFTVLEIDKESHIHVLECPYCKAGMLLSIKRNKLIGIESFQDNDPQSLMIGILRSKDAIMKSDEP
ncbi:MAG: hypothetical protein MRJ65_17830 [Candidatus Brocadiaceae bacterium]|nr:hypothetical protein [Candidatus Brocadiaceae bacterium]